MNCQQARPLIDFYADGELDAARVLELEKHLRECPACEGARKNAQTLKQALKQEGLVFKAPIELRRAITAELRSQPEAKSGWSLKTWWAAAGASFATACVAVLVTLATVEPSAQQRLADEVVSGHVRSLMASHELDVVSTDQHTVKPWFNGKLDFAPPVKDLVAQQFPLAGGRLDYIGGRTVAALVFHRNKHVINLFVWPASEKDSAPAVLSPKNGHNLVHWAKGEMTLWAVSDVNEKELMEFARAFLAE